MQGAQTNRRRDIVILTRSSADDEALALTLKARGQKVLVQPLLDVRPGEVPSPDFSGVQAVVVTSANAFGALGNVGRDALVPVFAVGQAAANAAKAAGFTDITTSPNVSSLADSVRDACSADAGTVLYLAGRDRAKDLPRMLAPLDVEVVQTYSAQTVRRLSPPVAAAIRNGRVKAITFHSQRAATAFVATCRNAGLTSKAQAIPALCLSRRIAAKLQAAGWRNTWSAPRPQTNLIAAKLTGQAAPPSPPQMDTVEAPANQFEANPATIIPPATEAPLSPVNNTVPPLATGEDEPIREEAMTTTERTTPSAAPSPANPTPANPTPGAPTQSPRASGPGWSALAIVVLIFALALYWLWTEVKTNDPGAADRTALVTKVDTASQRSQDATSALGERAKALELTAETLQSGIASLTARLEELAKTPALADRQTVDGLRRDVDAFSAEVKKLVSVPSPVPAINQRLDSLEAKAGSFGTRIGDAEAMIASLGSRMSASEGRADALAKTDQSLDERLAALKQDAQSRLTALEAGVADVTKQAAETSAALAKLSDMLAGQHSAVTGDIASLQERAEAASGQIAALEAWANNAQPDRVANQLIALADLRRLIDLGAPFAAPLQRVEAAFPNNKAPADDMAWTERKDDGIPTVATLSQRLTEITDATAPVGPLDSGNRWVDNAVGSLLSGVKVPGTKIGAPSPISQAAGEAQAALSRGDLAAADAAVAPIAETVPDIVKWREALQARLNASAALAAWENSVLAAIGEGSQ